MPEFLLIFVRMDLTTQPTLMYFVSSHPGVYPIFPGSLPPPESQDMKRRRRKRRKNRHAKNSRNEEGEADHAVGSENGEGDDGGDAEERPRDIIKLGRWAGKERSVCHR